jgi:small conductance mechanosensitive channel
MKIVSLRRTLDGKTSTGLAIAGALLLLVGCDLGAAGDGQAAEELPLIPLDGPPDRELKARLDSIFEEVEGVDGVRVAVRAGVVHLSGSAETLAAEQWANATASRLEGVVYVDSDLAQPAANTGLAAIGRTLRRLGRAAIDITPQIVAAVVVLIPFLLLSVALGRWRHPLRFFGMSSLSSNLLRVALRALLILVGVLLALDVLGIMATVGGVVGAVGVLGLAASFIFKDWVSNYLPGVMLGLHPPFKAGDLVKIGAHEGRVAQITPSATVLVTTDGEEVRIPNHEFFQATTINFSRHRARRLRFMVPVSPHADIEKTERLARRALLDVRGLLAEPPPFLRTRGLGRDQVDVELFAWVDQDLANFRNVESRAKRAVLGALIAGGIPLPEDTLVIHPAPREAEAVDEAFLAEQLALTRSRREERDLLEEGGAASESAVPSAS